MTSCQHSDRQGYKRAEKGIYWFGRDVFYGVASFQVVEQNQAQNEYATYAGAERSPK